MANTLKIKRGTAATIPQGQLAEPLFTTDTYDLYIGKGSGGNQRIQNYIASGTSSQFLKGDGTLDSTSYQPLITAGTTLQYYRGDKTFQTLDTSVVPENGPIYFTEPRVRATVLTGLNLSGGGTIAATDSILTAFGKVQNQISALVGGATYQGTWNASTNTPTLASGTGTKGYYYVVSVAGSTNLDGITDWKIGDWAIFNGTTWDKVDNTDAVSSVNGFTGAVNLALDNISDVSAASPTNAQLLRFNGTSSLWENWTPTFEPALTKGNLTEATSSVLTITGGTGAVIGSGTTIEVASAGAAQNGVVTTGTQTFAGAKTFSSDLTINGVEAGRGAGNDSSNTVFGYDVMNGSSTSVAGNTAIGYSAMNANTSGYGNTALGFGSLNTNTTGQSNTAIGLNAGQLIIGSYNTFVGRQAFSQATSGSNNTIIGYAAGLDITSGSNNTLIGGYTGPASALSGNVIISDGSGNIRFLHNGTNGKLPFLTSNGFVKTSGGDGTLSVDTTSYLPLTGGTITGNLVVNGNIALIATTGFPTVGFLHRATDNILYAKMPSGGFAFSDSLNNINLSISSSGALSGTSATFSDILAESKTADGIIQTIGGNSTKANIYQFTSGGLAGGVFNIGHNFYYDGTNYGQGNAAKSGWVISSNLNSDTFSIGRAAAGSTSAPTTILSLASTGAATFNSTVTTGDAFYLGASGNGGGTWTWGGSDAYIYSPTGKNLWLSSGVTGVNGLKIGTTGAATFSSSVTATSGLFSSSSSTNLTIERTGSNGVFVGLKDGSGNFAYIGNNNGDFLVQTPSGSYSTKLTILNGGNVGIGTTSPEQLLTVAGGSISVSGNTGLPRQILELTTASTVAIVRASYQGAGSYGDLALWTGGSERMRITSGGNVGIGTTSPSYKFHVSNAANGFISRFTGGTSSDVNIGIFGNTAAAFGSIGTESNHAFNLFTNGVDRVSITSGGNVGIGNSNPADYNANANNLVVGTTSGNTGITISSGNLSTGSLYFADGTTGNSEYRGYIEYQHGLDDLVIGTSAVARMTISGAGFYYLTNIAASSTANAANVYVNTTSGLLAYSTSSRKYKHDIRPYDRGINDLMKMNPVYYKGINDGNTQFAGLIAEEIDQLGMKEYVDYLNNEPNALRYSNMVTILVKAIQELKTELDTLKNR